MLMKAIFFKKEEYLPLYDNIYLKKFDIPYKPENSFLKRKSFWTQLILLISYF